MADSPILTPAKPAVTVKNVANPVKPVVPATASPAATAEPAKPRIKPEASGDDDSNSAGSESIPSSAKTPLMTGALGVAAAVLFIVVVVFWFKLNSRNESLLQAKNRSDQMAEQIGQLQTEIVGVKTDSARFKTLTDEAKALSFKDRADLGLAKADTLEVQDQLDKARVVSTGYQTQQEEAKVASLKRQGEVEIAEAKAAVMLVQWTKAQNDVAELKTELVAAKTAAADLQTKLDKAKAEIAAQPKTLPKK